MPEGARWEQQQSRGRARSPLRRVMLVAAVVFALIVGGIVVTALISGDRESLEFDYEGFD